MRSTTTDPTNEPSTPNEVAAVVRRYFDLAADLSAPPDALRDLLHPDLRVIEHPNALNPQARWRGTLAQDVGSRAAGTEISAEVAGFLTVADARIIAHETFDCYANM